MYCEDYPCCGHGPAPLGDGGGCPDAEGRFDCVLCGAKLPVGATSSICRDNDRVHRAIMAADGDFGDDDPFGEEDWGDYDDEGLRTVAEIDFGGSYEFDIIAVFEDVETGRRFWAHDSGCPSPFDGVGREELSPFNFDDIKAMIDDMSEYRREYLTEYLDIQSFLDSIRPTRFKR